MTFSIKPGTIIGYDKKGRPIRLIGGGSEPLPPGPGDVPPGGAPGNLPPAPVPVPTPGQYFTAEQLEAARQQEKDKLYGRMKTYEEQLAAFKTEADTWRSEREAAQAKAEAEEKARQEAEKKAAEARMSAEELIAAKQKEIDDAMAKFQRDMETRQAIMDKEHQFLSLQAYIQRRVAEEVAANSIADEFLDYIGGETEDAVEASITKAKEKTASIVAATLGQGQQPPAARPTGVSPTGFGPTGPLETISGQRQLTPEQIAAMSMEEFAAYRQQSGLAKAGKDKGMFG